MENFVFQYPKILYLLIIIPILLIWFIVKNIIHKKRLKKFANENVLKKIIYDYAPHKITKKFLLLLISLTLIIFAMARPKYLSYQEKVAISNAEIIFALDISNSMLVKDNNVKNLTRLDLAKNTIYQFLNKFNNEKVGLVIFAGTAAVQIPLTDDYNAFKVILQAIQPSFISQQGTYLAKAIELASNMFSENQNKLKVLIILTDGEDHEGNIDEAIKRAKNLGIKIYTIGIGSPRGNVIYLNNKILKDPEGKPVISKLNEQILQKIASETDGKYYRLTNSYSTFKEIFDDIDKVAKKELNTVKKYDEKFHYFAFPALILMFLEFFILERKNRWLRKFDIFKEN